MEGQVVRGRRAVGEQANGDVVRGQARGGTMLQGAARVEMQNKVERSGRGRMSDCLRFAWRTRCKARKGTKVQRHKGYLLGTLFM